MVQSLFLLAPKHLSIESILFPKVLKEIQIEGKTVDIF